MYMRRVGGISIGEIGTSWAVLYPELAEPKSLWTQVKDLRLAVLPIASDLRAVPRAVPDQRTNVTGWRHALEHAIRQIDNIFRCHRATAIHVGSGYARLRRMWSPKQSRDANELSCLS